MRCSVRPLGESYNEADEVGCFKPNPLRWEEQDGSLANRHHPNIATLATGKVVSNVVKRMIADGLRILHVSPYVVPDPSLGGVPQSVQSLCTALQHAGYHVTIWGSNI